VSEIRSIEWVPRQPGAPLPGSLRILDQTLLPERLVYRDIIRPEEVADAIRRLAVRGAPLLGVAAAYALVVAAQQAQQAGADTADAVRRAAALIRGTRPTAVNLFHGVDRILHILEHSSGSDDLALEIWKEADRLHREDREACEAIGRHGADLLPPGSRVLTHCNTGILATAGRGTALGAVYEAFRRHGKLHVFADETRPLWQGARLTAWELQQAGIPVTVLCDNAAAFLMASGQVDCIMVGADRIAANGDTANKVGTLALAIAARRYGLPFYVLAPVSTLDPSLPDGSGIEIEYRAAEEIVRPWGRNIAPQNVMVYAPAFDVTPAELITAIVTDRGIIRPPYERNIAAACGSSGSQRRATP